MVNKRLTNSCQYWLILIVHNCVRGQVCSHLCELVERGMGRGEGRAPGREGVARWNRPPPALPPSVAVQYPLVHKQNLVLSGVRKNFVNAERCVAKLFASNFSDCSFFISQIKCENCSNNRWCSNFSLICGLPFCLFLSSKGKGN